jgi:hypothetical protein
MRLLPEAALLSRLPPGNRPNLRGVSQKPHAGKSTKFISIMTKEEILKEFDELITKPRQLGETLQSRHYSMRQLVSSALDRYALSLVERSVPEEKHVYDEEHPDVRFQMEQAEHRSWNTCRSKTLKNAKQLLKP